MILAGCIASPRDGPCMLGEYRCEDLGGGRFALRDLSIEQKTGVTLFADDRVVHLVLEDVHISSYFVAMQVDCTCVIESVRSSFQGMMHGDFYWTWGWGLSPNVTYRGFALQGFAGTHVRTGDVSLEGLRLECADGATEAVSVDSPAKLSLYKGFIAGCVRGLGSEGERLLVRDTTFSGNDVGVVLSSPRASVATFENAWFLGNDVGIRGRGQVVELSAANSTFQSNRVGIELSGGNVTLDGVTFNGQTEAALLLNDAHIEGWRVSFMQNGLGCGECGAIVGSANGTIRASAFQGNQAAVWFVGATDTEYVQAQAGSFRLDAAGNWWGDPAGPSPSIAGQSMGQGDGISGPVRTQPHLMAPP